MIAQLKERFMKNKIKKWQTGAREIKCQDIMVIL